jgi:KDO2-lipid IV(A) lauroyltransferase
VETFIFRLAGRLPLPLLHALGVFLGSLTYLISGQYRRTLRANLAAAGFRSVRLAWAATAEAGKGAGELPYLWLRPHEAVVAKVRRVDGWQLAEEAWRQGRGVMFLTPHLGCFEITAQYIGDRMPLTVLYRPPKQRWLQPLVEQGRTAGRVKLASADLAGVRILMKALRRHEAIGILPDQVPGKGEGVWIEYFGRPAYTMTLAARLSETPGVKTLIVFAERLPAGNGYDLHFSEPACPIEGSTEQRALAINRSLETLIRRHPGQYLWSYNRYKRPAGAEPPPAEPGRWGAGP